MYPVLSLTVLAAEEIVDVTRRYTKKYDDVLTRRTSCSEDALSAALRRLNEAQITRMVPARQTEIRARQAREARELAGEVLTVERELKDSERIGRVS